MKIDEIKKSLKYKNYLYDGTIDIDTIKTTESYSFICDKGHIFNSTPQNVIKSFGEISCPICSNHRVLLGYNDMWTTAPELAKYLENEEDGYTHTRESNQKLKWKCPVCGNRFTKTANKVYNSLNKCQNCNFDISYPEKYILNFLEQCCVSFHKEKKFEWSCNKRYDFYLPEFQCIIEVHGNQHYVNSTFGSECKNIVYEIHNDTIKREEALKSREVKHYIELDCRNSNSEWIKKSILESDLPFILHITSSDINWDICDDYATSNITKVIWETYNSGETNITKLCDMFHLSKSSIRDKLNRGHQIGKCDYDGEIATKMANKRSGENAIKNMSKKVIGYSLSGNDVVEYNSIQEAQRITGIHHIWDCIVGRRKSAGGYTWKYKEG